MKPLLAAAILLAVMAAAKTADFPPAPDSPFVQEYRDEIAYPQIENANQARRSRQTATVERGSPRRRACFILRPAPGPKC